MSRLQEIGSNRAALRGLQEAVTKHSEGIWNLVNTMPLKYIETSNDHPAKTAREAIAALGRRVTIGNQRAPRSIPD